MYRFRDFEVDVGLYTLRKKGAAVDIQPKVLDLLIFLLTHAERVVSKDEILEAVWAGVAATDDVLNRAIHSARQAVGDDGVKQEFIQTVRGRGFRFVAPVELPETAATDPAPTESPLAQSGGLPFVGREQALSQLQSAFEDAQQGRGRVVFVAGEAGIGKTRLLEEFSRGASASGARVAAGWCWDGDGAPPYWPWVQTLRTLVEATDAETLRAQMGRGASQIAQIIPRLRDKLPELADEDGNRTVEESFLAFAHEDFERFQFFDSITRYLRQAASENTLVLILDNLQWADRSSLRLIEFLAQEIAGMRLLLVGAHHERELDSGHPLLETVGALVRQPTYIRVFLDGLPENEISQLLESIGGTPIPDRLASTVHAKTDGNPFLVTEIAQLVQHDPAALDTRSGDGRAFALPRGVTAIVQQRLAIVPPLVRRVLSLAAVAGQEFSRAVLEHALEGEIRPESLDEALDSSIIVELPGSPGLYRFKHALIREALYDELGASQRARLHHQIAEALEAIQADGAASESYVAQIAYHFSEATTSKATLESLEKAIQLKKQAGETANKQLAYEDAASHFRDTLELLAQREASMAAERCKLLLAAAHAERNAGNIPRARETMAAASDAARKANSPELLAQAALGIQAPFTWLSGSLDPLEISLLEEALAAIPDDQERLRVQLLTSLAFSLYWSGDKKRIVQVAQRAAEIAARIGDPALIATANVEYLYAQSFPHSPDQLDAARECVRLAHEAGDHEADLVTRTTTIDTAISLGNPSAWTEDLPAFEQIASQTQLPAARWYAKCANATMLFLKGRLDEAQEASESAGAMAERLGDVSMTSCLPLQLYPLRREQQQLDHSEAYVRQSAKEFPTGSLWHCSLGHLSNYLGYKDEARKIFSSLAEERFEGIVTDTGWRVSMHLLSELCRDVGDPESAAILYRQLLPHDGKVASLSFVTAHGPVSRDLGILAAITGNLNEASKHFEDAMKTSHEFGSITVTARIRYDYARALFEHGNAAHHVQGLALAQQATNDARTYELTALQLNLHSLLQTH